MQRTRRQPRTRRRRRGHGRRQPAHDSHDPQHARLVEELLLDVQATDVLPAVYAELEHGGLAAVFDGQGAGGTFAPGHWGAEDC